MDYTTNLPTAGDRRYPQRSTGWFAGAREATNKCLGSVKHYPSSWARTINARKEARAWASGRAYKLLTKCDCPEDTCLHPQINFMSGEPGPLRNDPSRIASEKKSFFMAAAGRYAPLLTGDSAADSRELSLAQTRHQAAVAAFCKALDNSQATLETEARLVLEEVFLG